VTLTNSLSLPDPIVEAIRADDYNPGDSEFTTNQLIKPVRINALTQKYRSQLAEDASDRIFTLMGQAVHIILDRAGGENKRYIVKKRYFLDFEGTKISGEIDVFDTATCLLSDYKLCSRYVVEDGVKPEWEAQDNMNAFLMAQNGVYVQSMNIVAIFRDWSKMAAARSPDNYPQKQIAVLDVKPWPENQTVMYIRDRIKAHKDGRETPPLCTPEERWHVPTMWALKKKGNKRATKLYESKEQAEHQAALNNGDFPKNQWVVEERPGDDKRCRFYCPVVRFCDFGRMVIG
jgi:hypothetical protein